MMFQSGQTIQITANKLLSNLTVEFLKGVPFYWRGCLIVGYNYYRLYLLLRASRGDILFAVLNSANALSTTHTELMSAIKRHLFFSIFMALNLLRNFTASICR